MNKNAYEIRLEVLQMAHADEDRRFSEKLQALYGQEERDQKRRVDNITVDSLFPDTSAVVERAERLYQFVDNS